jgi:hypothetical protein
VTAEQVNGQTGDPLEALLGGPEGGQQEVGMTATTAHRQQERLLHQVGGVQLRLQARVQLQPGQEAQVRAPAPQ